MTNFRVQEGTSSSFTYSFSGYNPVVTVEFVPGTATTGDGYGGTRTGSSIVNINGYIYGEYTYSFGAYADAIDEEDEQFTLNVYYNGILDETVTVTIIDDLAVHGTNTSDTWRGSAEDDTFFAYDGADIVLARDGDDDISAGGGHDQVSGGNGHDTLIGQSGNDTLDGGNGSDILTGGAGRDVLSGAGGADTLTGGAGHDQLLGGAMGDTLSGANGDDSLSGGRGHDQLQGGNGNDTLEGGKGRDSIDGGKGNDTLTGGESADTFIFSGVFGHDTVTDFEIAGREKIDLSALDEVRNFKDLARNFATDTDEGVLIEIDNRSSILIEGTEISELSGRDFIF